MDLYTATIPQFLQVLGSMQTTLAKGEAFFSEAGRMPAEIFEARLREDMHPFPFQVRAMKRHSAGAIVAAEAGQFVPDPSPLPTDFASLHKMLADAVDDLRKVTPQQLDAIAGKVVSLPAINKKFTVEKLLLSFSIPNFFFHTATAYGLLRSKGVPIGKADYLGRLQALE